MPWLNRLEAGGSARGTPRRHPCRHARYAAALITASFVFLVSGCQSGPFSQCGDGNGLFSPCGFFGRVSSRVFNRSNGACCGSEVVSGVPVESATPAVVTPGAVPASPMPPGATFKSYPAPGTTDTPTELEQVSPPAAPKSKIQSPTTSGSSSGQAGTGNIRSGYQTRGPDPGTRIARRRSRDQATTMSSTPVPASRPAQAETRQKPAAAPGPGDDDPLDHLPPLDLPGEVTRPASPAGASAAGVSPATALSPAAASAIAADARLDSPAAEADEVELASATVPAPDPSRSASIGPGLARFVAVDLKLAGGSVPAAAGLDWLAEKGYRTVLDLRQSSEVSPSFIADVTNRGLRYVALPISPASIDRDHFSRFNFEIGSSDARPLFFFDSDGTRSGALWYIRRTTVDRVDHQVARREAEELGLSDQTYWSAVTRFVASLGLAKEASRAGDPRPGSSLQSVPAAPASRDKPAPGSKNPAAATSTAQEPQNAGIAPAEATPRNDRPATPATGLVEPPSSGRAGAAGASPSTSATGGEYVALRPLAAIVITGLSLPLAYWSRTALPTMLFKARASLPGGGPRPKSLPGELGA